MGSASRESTCGNGWCEWGEQSRAGQPANISFCPSDCVVEMLACPLGASDLTCSGVGVCVPATASCDCFTGYAGADCSQCATGFFPNGDRCLPAAAFDGSAMPPVEAAPSSALSSRSQWIIFGVCLGVLILIATAVAALFLARLLRLPTQSRAPQQPPVMPQDQGREIRSQPQLKVRTPPARGGGISFSDRVRSPGTILSMASVPCGRSDAVSPSALEAGVRPASAPSSPPHAAFSQPPRAEARIRADIRSVGSRGAHHPVAPTSAANAELPKNAAFAKGEREAACPHAVGTKGVLNSPHQRNADGQAVESDGSARDAISCAGSAAVSPQIPAAHCTAERPHPTNACMSTPRQVTSSHVMKKRSGVSSTLQRQDDEVADAPPRTSSIADAASEVPFQPASSASEEHEVSGPPSMASVWARLRGLGGASAPSNGPPEAQSHPQGIASAPSPAGASNRTGACASSTPQNKLPPTSPDVVAIHEQHAALQRIKTELLLRQHMEKLEASLTPVRGGGRRGDSSQMRSAKDALASSFWMIPPESTASQPHADDDTGAQRQRESNVASDVPSIVIDPIDRPIAAEPAQAAAAPPERDGVESVETTVGARQPSSQPMTSVGLMPRLQQIYASFSRPRATDGRRGKSPAEPSSSVPPVAGEGRPPPASSQPPAPLNYFATTATAVWRGGRVPPQSSAGLIDVGAAAARGRQQQGRSSQPYHHHHQQPAARGVVHAERASPSPAGRGTPDGRHK